MNIGEKITSYKEKLGFKNYQDFSKAAGLSGEWLLEASKKQELKVVDVNNLIKICGYLGVTIEQLIVDDNSINISEGNATENITDPDDIGTLLNELVDSLSNKEGCKLDGVLMNNKSKEICKDSLEVVRILIKQHL